METSRENIEVSVRFRPLNSRELKQSSNKITFDIDTENNSLKILNSLSNRDEEHTFFFDHVFDEHIAQETIFTQVAENAVSWVKEGYNATIFTYGPTGSGKTFTMFGTEQDQGIIPRACEMVFNLIADDDNVTEAYIQCSFLEIYRERIYDLLNKNGRDNNLRIRQHQDKGVFVQGLIEKFVYCPEDILETIDEGAKQRSTASTALNNTSSRSHAVLTLNIKQLLNDGSELLSKLHLIDLAGSENVGKSEVTGVSLSEAQMINQSLSSLGNVIYALTEPNRSHIPYRDSRLTYLLQDSLGGNSKTTLITTATPHSDAIGETMNTLKFAQRAKLIKNIPTINRNESNANLKKIIKDLQRQLAELSDKYAYSQTIVEHHNVEQTSEEIGVLHAELDKLRKENVQLRAQLVEQTKKASTSNDLFYKQRELAQTVSKKLRDAQVQNNTYEHIIRQYELFVDSIKTTHVELLPERINKFVISLPPKTFTAPIQADLDSPSVSSLG